MSKDLNDVAPSRGEVGTLYVALEVSGTSRAVGIGDPGEPGKVGKAGAGADGPSRVLPTCGAGYEGFRLARWLGEHAPQVGVVIGDPASLEVVRRGKKAKTGRIDARRMVRALRARDGGASAW